jgi:WD40 repeat protein
MITTVAFGPDGRIAGGGWDNKVRVWNASTLRMTLEIDLRESGDLILDLAFSPDGSRIVTGSRQDKTGNPTVKVWDTRTGAEALILRRAPSEVCRSVAFGSTRIAAGCYNQTTAARTLYMWDARSGAEVQAVKESEAPVAFNPDGTRVAFVDRATQSLRLWNTKTESMEKITIDGKSSKGINAVAFNHDGTLIVSGNMDGTLRLWDAVSGKERGSATKAHNGIVNEVAFNQDGTLIVSGGKDGAIKLWTWTGAALTEKGTYRVKDTAGVETVAFSRDGKRIASGGSDGIKMWDVTP